MLGLATNGVADELALEMLGHLLDDLPIVVGVSPRGACSLRNSCRWYKRKGSRLSASLISPAQPSVQDTLSRQGLHAALPEVRILVGRWSPRALADDSTQVLRDAALTLVASTLAETRYLGGLVEISRVPLPEASSVWRLTPTKCQAKTKVFGSIGCLGKHSRRGGGRVGSLDETTRLMRVSVWIRRSLSEMNRHRRRDGLHRRPSRPAPLEAGYFCGCVVRSPRKLEGRDWTSDPRVDVAI